MSIIASLFKPSQPVPLEYKSNFSHLYLDIAWFGIVSGSVQAFIAIYAARLGASPQAVGLLTAIPAIVSLVFAMPAGRFLETSPSLHKPVFQFAVIYRSIYLLWAILPWFFADKTQVTLILVITFLSSIPLTYLSVGFNALFADAVPSEWRGHVAGIRNVAFALTSTITSLICGWILNSMKFPDGYQVVFGLGFIGAMMSSIHVYRVRPVCKNEKCTANARDTNHGTTSTRNLILRMLAFVRKGPAALFRFRMDILSGSFGRVLGLLTIFHLSQYLPISLFPIVYVNTLHFSDQFISIGTAANSAALFIGSTFLSRACSRWGYHKVTAIGIATFGVYPFFLSVSSSLLAFVTISILSGLAWSMAGGSLYNYLLEKVPPDNRPPYLAWYNIGLNAAILLGSLAGPWMGDQIGYPQALFLFGAARTLIGLAILRLG